MPEPRTQSGLYPMPTYEYVCYWGMYQQWKKSFASDREAIAEMEKRFKDEKGVALYRMEMIHAS